MHQTKIQKKLISFYYGIYAEKIVKFFLILKGYEIEKTRFKTYLGEIDIIAKKKKLLIFIEVKARTKVKIQLDQIISQQQISRIKNSSDIFLSKKPQFWQYDIRYDLITISNYFSINHYIDFF